MRTLEDKFAKLHNLINLYNFKEYIDRSLRFMLAVIDIIL